MKITKVDVLHLKTNLKNGHWRPIVCRIYTDEGIYGDGEAALAYGEAQSAAFGIVQNFAKLIIGMNPLDHEIIWDKLYRSTFWGQNGGPVIFAGISAIDIADAERAMHTIKTIVEDPEIGAIYKGKVTRLMTFGAFVEIAPGKEGLVHISKLDTKRVEKVEDVVAVGDELLVKVTEIDQQGRINLSRKDALADLAAKQK